MLNTILAAAATLLLSLPMHGATVAGDSVALPANDPHPGSSSPPSCNHYWCTFRGAGYVSVAYTTQGGPDGQADLDGFRVRWGGWEEDPYRLGFARPFPDAGGPHFWLGEARNGEQELWTGGLGYDLSFVALGPVRVFVRPQLGVTYRTDEPDDGWGAVAGLGLGTGVLLGHRWQLVFALDRDFDFTAPDSYRSSLEVRWLSSKIQFPLAE